MVISDLSGLSKGKIYRYAWLNPTVTSSVFYILALAQLCLGANTQFFRLNTAIKLRVGWTIVATQLLAIFLSLFGSYIIEMTEGLLYILIFVMMFYILVKLLDGSL